MGWKGPYYMVERLSPLDYRIKIGVKVKTFQINMLKQYVEREKDDQEVQHNNASQVCVVALVDLTAKEMEDK